MGEGPGAILVLRHSFLSLTDCWWLYNIQLKTSRGVLFLPPSNAYVRSFLYLLYTLIKLYYTKALSGQASSLAPDWILFLRGPRIPASWFNNNLSVAQLYDFTLSHWIVHFKWVKFLWYMNYILITFLLKKTTVQVTSNWQNVYIAMDPKRNTWVWN